MLHGSKAALLVLLGLLLLCSKQSFALGELLCAVRSS